MHGNTSVHQAAASREEGSFHVLQCFLSRGVDVNQTNARGHTPLDLATSQNVRDLIVKAQKTLYCQGNNCNKSKFDFKNIRYYCTSCKKFFCDRCSTCSWVFEDKDSKEENRPVCRCDDCLKKIIQSEEDMRAAMETMDFATVDKALNQIKKEEVDIDV